MCMLERVDREMKIQVELDDKVVEKVEKAYKIDVETLIEESVSNTLNGLAEAAMVVEAGIPVSKKKLFDFGGEIGRRAFEKAAEAWLEKKKKS